MYIQISSTSTHCWILGSIVALCGHTTDKGKFHVEEYCFSGFPYQTAPTLEPCLAQGEDRWVISCSFVFIVLKIFLLGSSGVGWNVVTATMHIIGCRVEVCVNYLFLTFAHVSLCYSVFGVILWSALKLWPMSSSEVELCNIFYQLEVVEEKDEQGTLWYLSICSWDNNWVRYSFV